MKKGRICFGVSVCLAISMCSGCFVQTGGNTSTASKNGFDEMVSNFEEIVSGVDDVVHEIDDSATDLYQDIADATGELIYTGEKGEVYEAIMTYFDSVKERRIDLSYEIPGVGQQTDQETATYTVLMKDLDININTQINDYQHDSAHYYYNEELMKGLDGLVVTVTSIDIPDNDNNGVYPLFERKATANLTIVYKDYSPVAKKVVELCSNPEGNISEEEMYGLFDYYGITPEEAVESGTDLGDMLMGYLVYEYRDLAQEVTRTDAQAEIWYANGKWTFESISSDADLWQNCCTCGIIGYAKELGYLAELY